MSLAVRVALAALLLLPLPAWSSRAVAAPDFSGVDEAVRDAVDSGEIPGAVTLVGQGDRVLYLRAHGWRQLVPERVPMTADTVFDVASLTKPLGTTLAILALVERGALRLDAPLGRYLREFHQRAYREVTIERLLTHTAGLAPTPPNGSLAGGFPQAARALASRPLHYAPGTGFAYSDTGFILLGEVVRRVGGEPLDRFLARLLFRPLGLRDTAFHPDGPLRERAAPTEFASGHLLRGEVHDPRARQLGGVAGHAGMFSTAGDIARILRMLLAGGQLDGHRVLAPATVARMWSPNGQASGTRALGWDVSSAFSRTMAPYFPAGSVGHTGFTGTAVWVDPPSQTYMILLTNRVHPSGGGSARIRELRQRVAAAVGSALFVPALPPPSPGGRAATEAVPAGRAGSPAPAAVRTGLDVLVAQGFAPLRGHAVGVVTNHSGIDAEGRRGIDLIHMAPGVRVQAILSPEHGITGRLDADVPHGRDAATGRPIWSLYGPTRRPTDEMLRDVTMLVFDVQDVGTRYYTYLTTLLYVLEDAARRRLPVVVLDRPNPIGGRVVEGPLMDPDLASFTGPHPLPVRTGVTIGEYARLVVAERGLRVALTVVPMEGWRRDMWFDQTGLPWVNPSPNIRSVTEALLYSGIGLLEATNLSVGRGTDTPFEVVGAPWVEPAGLAARLDARRLAGVRIEPVRFTPTGDKHANVECGGIRLVVTDRDAIRPVTVALAIAEALHERHRHQFRPESIQNLLVNRSTMWAILRGEPLERLTAWAAADHAEFLQRRASYLIYP